MDNDVWGCMVFFLQSPLHDSQINTYFSLPLENEAAQRRKCDEKFKNFGASHAIITSDTQDQFRLFYMLERFLQSPPMLAKQMLLQISPDVQDILIERHVTPVFC